MTTEQEGYKIRRYQEAVVARVLRTHGRMSANRADDLAIQVVIALIELGWLHTTILGDDK